MEGKLTLGKMKKHEKYNTNWMEIGDFQKLLMKP